METETFNAGAAIGMDEKWAEEFFAQFNYSMRVTRRDGQDCIITRDYRFDRVNVTVREGKVIEISYVG